MGPTEVTPGSHDHPLELEVSTTEPARPVEQNEATVEGLSLTEAASAYGVSLKTVQRRAQAGELIGAVKVPGAKGVSWVVPLGAMEKLGYKLKETKAAATVRAQRSEAGNEQLAARVQELEALLELERVMHEATKKEALDLRESLSSERATVEVLRALVPKELESGKHKRWWRK
jgi:hypothetical protein